jgi:phenylpropionate dioxygenase-like ring-hydroxylating dioxygenase large terminal subunit
MDPRIPERVKAAIESARGTRRDTVTLPAGRFTDPEFLTAERALFARTWVLAGRGDEVPGPGRYMTWEKTCVPLIVVDSVDGTIRCFYNSCRHRGAPVVREARGRNRALRCQYHSWTYDTFGNLVSVPDERDFVDLRREERPLVPVRCETWGGWIFVNEDKGAAPLAAQLAEAAVELSGLGVGGLQTIDQSSVTTRSNWKAVMQRFLESLPVPPRPGVPELAVETAAACAEDLGNGNLRIVAPFTEESAAALGLAGPLDWRPVSDPGLADLGSLDGMICSTVTAYLLFPNVVLTFVPSGALSLALWPMDQATTQLDATWYAAGWGEDDPPAEASAWQERTAWSARLLAAAKEALDPVQPALEERARQGLSVSSESELARRWNMVLDERLGVHVSADHRVRAARGRPRPPPAN